MDQGGEKPPCHSAATYNLPDAACLTIPIGRARIFHLVSSNRVGTHSRCSSHHPSHHPIGSITAGGSGSDGARSREGHRQRRLAERGPYWPPQRQAATVSLPRRASHSFRLKVEPSWQESQRLFYA